MAWSVTSTICNLFSLRLLALSLRSGSLNFPLFLDLNLYFKLFSCISSLNLSFVQILWNWNRFETHLSNFKPSRPLTPPPATSQTKFMKSNPGPGVRTALKSEMVSKILLAKTSFIWWLIERERFDNLCDLFCNKWQEALLLYLRF